MKPIADAIETRRLRHLIERPERARLWGMTFTITPRLIARKFGDGQRLICIQPLATRPNYLVARVDSKTKDVRDPAPPDSEWRSRGACDVSLLEEIMLAAEDEYGFFGDENGDEVVDWGIGATWGETFPIDEWIPTPSVRLGPPRFGVLMRDE